MKLKYILPILSLLLFFASCDNFLDVKPVGKVIPTTVPEFRSLITEAYATVPDDRGLASFRSDEVLLDQTMSVNDLNSYLDIWRWNDSAPDENTASFSWRQFYHVLFIANYVIESEKSMTGGSKEEVEQLVGEAYMLRAYMHFILANLHAPAYTACNPAETLAIPLKLDSDVDGVLSRNSLKEVYNQIFADIETALKYLNIENWSAGYNYRFSPLAARAILSRVALYAGDWELALQSAREVLKSRNELANPVSIMPNAFNSPENILAIEEVMSAQYARTVKVNRDFFKLFSSSDLRKKTYFNQVTSSNILLSKGGSNKFACTVRTAEMYLNAAEAALRINDAEQAKSFLLSLQRARFSDAGAAKENAVKEMNNDELLEEILNERARELAFEGHRWFDLRRTSRPRLERTFKGETYVLEQDDPRYTIRIPSSAITANPGLAN